MQAFGIGTDTAAKILITFGDNAERIHSEAAFAKMCGICPIPVSFGKTHRHPPTQNYIARRTAQGLSKQEIIRCLKRDVAREIYHLIRKPHPAPEVPELIRS